GNFPAVHRQTSTVGNPLWFACSGDRFVLVYLGVDLPPAAAVLCPSYVVASILVFRTNCLHGWQKRTSNGDATFLWIRSHFRSICDLFAGKGPVHHHATRLDAANLLLYEQTADYVRCRGCHLRCHCCAIHEVLLDEYQRWECKPLVH